MTYIVKEFSGDFQQGGCLCKPTSDSDQWTSEYSWTSDKPQKQASKKHTMSTIGSGVLVNI